MAAATPAEAHPDDADPAGLTRRIEVLLLLLVVALALARVLATYTVFSQVFDEPYQLAGGLQWIDQHAFTTVPYTPPLARVLFAIGPHLDGARFVNVADPIASGNGALYSGDYTRRLTLARTGNLPFLILGILVVWLLTRRLAGKVAAAIAAALFSFLPAILGNAGVATTDMAVTATLGAAVLLFIEWLDRPTIARSGALGAVAALTILSKLSALLFLPVCLAVLVGFHLIALRGEAPLRKLGARSLAGRMAVVALAGFLVIWAVYLFSWIPASRAPELVLSDSPLQPFFALWEHSGLPIPAPELLAGMTMLYETNHRANFPSYFMGEVHRKGSVLFNPVLFVVKTPLPYLVLCVGGSILFFRRRKSMPWAAPSLAAAALAIVVISMSFQVNGGARYVMPIYALLTPAAAGAVVWCWSRWPRGGAAVALLMLIGMASSSLLAHPDYIAYFNLLAGGHPERISVTADLDWGQDLLRVRQAALDHHVDRLWLAYFGSAIPAKHDLGAPFEILQPNQRVRGWIVVSEVFRHPIWTRGYLWLNAYEPVAQIGKSLWLYRIP